MAVARSLLRASSFVTTLTAGIESELLVIIIIILFFVIIIILIDIVVIIIITINTLTAGIESELHVIIITRPWPAFGRQGLDGSSERYNSKW